MKTVILGIGLILGGSIASSAQTITTFAGNGATGSSGDGGAASAAAVEFPTGISFDYDGNLLVSQKGHVRKISIAGIISNVAGSDTATNAGGGNDGGPATCAFLMLPYHVVSDGQGNIFLADNWYRKVRKVTRATGIITTVVGTGSSGGSGDGGPATSATFNSINCIVVDTSRNCLYVSDAYDYKVRKIDLTTGLITRYAGTGINGSSGDGGPATAASVSRVFGLSLDKTGNLYVGDWDNARIRKVDVVTGTISTYAGNGTLGFGGDGGPATNAKITKPTALCFDIDGNLFFSDEDNNRVRRIDSATGIITTVAGNGTAGFAGDGGPATNARFNHPTGIAIDRNGDLFVGDYYNHRVRKVTNVSRSVVSVPSNPIPAHPVIYPNPTKGKLQIAVTEDDREFSISNVLGVVVHKGKLKVGTTTIIIEELPSGTYVVEVTARDGKVVSRIVKE